MDAKNWQERIKDAAVSVGTYRPAFDSVIETLADILARRDQIREAFEESGEPSVVEHTNKGGSTNLEQNPAVRLINDLNRDALAYWRDLGLTPAGLKRINEKAMEKRKGNALAEALRELGG